jgi:hypothetical protein
MKYRFPSCEYGLSHFLILFFWNYPLPFRLGGYCSTKTKLDKSKLKVVGLMNNFASIIIVLLIKYEKVLSNSSFYCCDRNVKERELMNEI